MSENDWRTEPMTIKDLQSNLAGIIKQFPGAEDFVITVKTDTGRHNIVRGLIIQRPNPFFSEEDTGGAVQFFTPDTVDYFNGGGSWIRLKGKMYNPNDVVEFNPHKPIVPIELNFQERGDIAWKSTHHPTKDPNHD